MKIVGSRFRTMAGLAGLAGLLVNVNCGSSGGGGTAGSGGTSTGGKGGTTGTAGTGGTAGSGGQAGTTDTGGSAGSTAGAGGAAGATAGAGGHAGAGGAAGSNTDGGVALAAFSYTFDQNTQGFALDTFTPTDGSTNLAMTEGGSVPSLTWDSAVGSPSPGAAGSLKVDATFSGYRQFVLTSIVLSPTTDAAQKTIHAWVMLDQQDGGATFPGGAQLEASTGSNFNGVAAGPLTTLTPGSWTELTLNLATPAAPFDASQLVEISVQFVTGAQPEGGTFGGPIHETFHIDTITDGSGNAAPPPLNVTFDVNTQAFAVGPFGAVPDGGAAPTLTFDSALGDPNPGSIAVTLPFTTYGQVYGVESNVKPTTNLSGKTIHAKIMLDGAAAAFTQLGYVDLFAQSNGYIYGRGTTTGLTAGVWTDLSMTVSAPAAMNTGYDPTQIIQVGVEIGVGAMPDGGVFGASEAPTFHLDSFVAQ
jgi:hypothetical protein